MATMAAVIVTVLWASSYIINRYAFADGIGSFTLAGSRYLVAAIAMFIIAKVSGHKKGEEKEHSRLTWKQYVILGVTGFFIATGFQYFGQFYLDPTQTSLLIQVCNAAAIVVVDIVWIKEIQNARTFLIIAMSTIGALVYFYPWHFDRENAIGIICIAIASVGYAVYSGYTRKIVSQSNIKIKNMLYIPMFIGAFAMLAVGLLTEPLPSITVRLMLTIVWLGVVNGALAYGVWSWSQRYLRMYESSVINNLVLIEVVLMDVALLQREYSIVQIAGLALVLLAVLFSQNRGAGRQKSSIPDS